MSIPQINNVGVRDVNVFRIDVPQIYSLPPAVQTVPFILNIGSPVVNMPGCVKYHPDAADNRETPNLKEDDSNGTRVLCDADYPTYDAMDYTPEELNIYVETPPPAVEPPPDPPGAPEVPDTTNVNTEVECPAPNQPRIGDVAQNQKEKVSGYELRDGICVILYEDIGAVEQYLPSAQVATTTAVIATVAGASALLAKPLADLLLRVFRPAIKKVLTKANAILGRKNVHLSRSDVQANQYRQKRGLPPVKKRR